MGSGIWRMISWRHFLVLSVSINVGLISKVMLSLSSISSSSSEGSGLFGKYGLVKELLTSSMADVMALDGLGLIKKSSQLSTTGVSKTETSARAGAGSGVEDDGRVINLDHGDPTMYEAFWKQMGEKTTITIPGWQSLSYFSDAARLCWFLEPEFAKQVVRLHKKVANAITENHHIVVGTGSTQLYQAALYALSPDDASAPMNIVSAAPFYSSYPLMTDYLKSGLYRWGGDACNFDEQGPYIELVTSPNNPDGFSRKPVVNRTDGILIHDFAYYWPQYTPLSSPADHDLMLFTVSKSTGHAGTRIGWALVKDEQVAKRMTKFIELNTIGVSKDSQLRAAKILEAVSDSCEHVDDPKVETFFEFSYQRMAKRWRQLREAVKMSGQFSLPNFPSEFCNFHGLVFEPQPAFAWLKCEGQIDDCESFLRSHKILTRGGIHFGSTSEYVRISMLDRDENYNRFIWRLSRISLQKDQSV